MVILNLKLYLWVKEQQRANGESLSFKIITSMPFKGSEDNLIKKNREKIIQKFVSSSTKLLQSLLKAALKINKTPPSSFMVGPFARNSYFMWLF